MKKIKLKLEQIEFEIIINGLVEFRNKLIREKEDTNPVADLLLKLLDNKKQTYLELIIIVGSFLCPYIATLFL